MNQNINVDLIPKFAVYGNLYFSQYDVGREAIINLVNGSTEYEIPNGATVTLVATKPSGLGFTQNCTFEGNQITVVCTAEMTDEAGKFPCEIRIVQGSTILGTANFTFNVEKSPHPEGTTDGTADSVISQITVAFETAMDNIEHSGGLTSAIKNAILNCFQKVAWIDQNGQTYYNALSDALFAVTNITLNASSLLFNSIGSTQQLTATLVPSDSTAQVQWESSDTSVVTVSSSGLVTSVADGNATITASVGEVSATCSVSVVEITVESLNAVLNASGHTFYAGDDINDIKPYLTVTATYSDSTTATIPSGSYTLSGSLVAGENTITVSYEGVSTTVTVTAVASVLASISAVYTQSGYVYTTDTLDSLKSDLAVTAHYSDSSTSTVASADYTLSGTLTEGTSTITVSYDGKTTTFNVTVSGEEVNILSYELGAINTDGTDLESTTRYRTDYIPVTNGDYIFFGGEKFETIYRLYDSNKAFVGSLPSNGWETLNYKQITQTGYVRVTFRKSDNSTLIEGALDGKQILYVNNEPYFFGSVPPVQTLNVKLGYGVSATDDTIVSNANRCVSSKIPFGDTMFGSCFNDTNSGRASIQFPYDSNGNRLTWTAAYSPNASGWGVIHGNAKVLSVASPTGTTHIRISFANEGSDTAMTSVPTGIVYVNAQRYRIQEGEVE